MNRLCQTIGISVILTRSLCSGTIAQSYEELKEDIQRRAEIIEEYKRQGGLVEGPDGMLKPKPDAAAELSEAAGKENEARRRIFERIAERTGATTAEVARFFAERVPPVQQKTPEDPQSPRISQPAAPEATPPGSFVPVAPGSSLPLKILTRPGSKLFAEPSDAAKVVDAGVPAFSTRVVAAMRDGWYQVTDAVGQPPIGWMLAADVMEWRHHMVVSFTHPGNRSRSIFFKEKKSLTDLLKLSRDQRRTEWSQLLELAAKGAAPAVVGLEPEGWLREKNQFYLLPIVDQDAGTDVGHELMFLKVAAASRPRPAPVWAKPKLDIIFVMDLTRSMGPFVEATLKMLRDVSGSIGGSSSDPEAVRFGLWGYRDNPDMCKGIDFNTKNFTEELQDLPMFLKTLESVDETQIDSIDYAEDVLAGVHDAIEQTKWRSGAARTILLVGDAPGRAPEESEPECRLSPKPKGTASGMDARTIRARANDKSVYLGAFYLESPRWKGFTERGLKQFRELSLNPGSNSPDCKLLNGVNSEDYTKASSLWASTLGENLKSLATDGKLPEESELDPDKVTSEQAAKKMADNVFRNAFIEWSSAQKELEVPRDIQGWVSDKDPNDPALITMEPGVLLNKTQLSGLRDRVSQLLDTLQRQQIEGGDFFRQLQTVVAISGRDPGRLSEAESLQKSQYFEDFLTGLPYKSTIMKMTSEDWRELGADRTNQLTSEMKAKIKYYIGVYEDASKWQRLSEDADSGDFVAPILIDMLP
jgi:uncharacterized protein YdbL (DUF1318 family)